MTELCVSETRPLVDSCRYCNDIQQATQTSRLIQLPANLRVNYSASHKSLAGRDACLLLPVLSILLLHQAKTGPPGAVNAKQYHAHHSALDAS